MRTLTVTTGRRNGGPVIGNQQIEQFPIKDAGISAASRELGGNVPSTDRGDRISGPPHPPPRGPGRFPIAFLPWTA